MSRFLMILFPKHSFPDPLRQTLIASVLSEIHSMHILRCTLSIFTKQQTPLSLLIEAFTARINRTLF